MNNSLGKSSIIISLALHLLLAGLFFVLKYELIPSELKPIKLMQFGYRESSYSQNKTSEIKPSTTKISDYKFGKKSSYAPRKVKVPVANIQSEHKVFVPQSSKKILNKLDLNEEIGNSFNSDDTKLSKLFSAENELVKEETVLPKMDDFLSALNNSLSDDITGEAPFLLEGDIATRKVLQREIPEYPNGMQKSVRVRIRLEVRADGSVGKMIILQKAGSPFDENTMKALKNWKFNPIAGNEVQTGTITFNYNLK
jgi:TonB family protein